MVPFAERRSIQQQGDRCPDRGRRDDDPTRLPAAGAGRGSAARIACPAPTSAGWSPGPAGSSTSPTGRRYPGHDPGLPGDDRVPPQRVGGAVRPDRLPVDDSQLFAPPPLERTPTPTAEGQSQAAAAATETGALEAARAAADGPLHGHAAREDAAAGQARGRTVAGTPQRTFAPGRQQLRLGLSRKRYPTRLAFKIRRSSGDERPKAGTPAGFRASSSPVFAVASPRSPGSGQPATMPGGHPPPLLGPADSAHDPDGGPRMVTRARPGGTGLPLDGWRRCGSAPATSSSGRRSTQPPIRSSRSCATPIQAGWQVFDTPVDESASPIAGPSPTGSRRGSPARAAASSSAATSPAGRRAAGRPRPRSRRRLARARSARLPSVLMPADVSQPAETLADDHGSGNVAVAAIDEGPHTGLFFGPQGRSVADAIVHFDGSGWTREPICLGATPTPCVAPTVHFRILAIDATGLGNVWAIAEADSSLNRSVCSARAYRHPGRARLGGAPAGRDPVRRSRQPRAGDRRRRADRGRGSAADCHL